MKPRKPNPTTLNVYFVKSVWTQMKSPSTSLVYLYLRNKTSLKQKEKENELPKEFQIKSKYGADTSFLKRLNWCLSGAITNAIVKLVSFWCNNKCYQWIINDKV